MQSNHQNSMAGLFPAIDDIPEDIRLTGPLFQRHILINGQLRDWDGPTQTVTSPVFVRKEQADIAEPFLIGSYPLATIKEANEALVSSMLQNRTLL